MKGKWHRLLPYVFMLIAAVSRWPGLFPPNFSVFYALSFCAGAFFPGLMAWLLPLGTMIVTDVLLNVFIYHAPVLSWYMLITAAPFAGLILFGKLFPRRSSWGSLLAGGLVGALVFYLITNTGSWLYDPEYPKTFAGWLQALTFGTQGNPPTWTFFRNTFLSGGLFTGLFASAFKLTADSEPAEGNEPKEAPSEEPEAEPVAEES